MFRFVHYKTEAGQKSIIKKIFRTMINKFSTLVVFLILGLVAPIFASSSPCNCQVLPSHVGTIIGDLDDLIDEVVSDVIEPVGSAVTSLLDNLLSGLLGSDGLDLDGLLGNDNGLLGGLLGSDGVDLDGLLGSDGIDLGDVVSEVGDLLENLLDSDSLDLSACVGIDIYQNSLFYRFNSGYSNHLVLHGFTSDEILTIALFTGGCDDLTCVYVNWDFCGDSHDLAIVVEPFTDYWIGVLGAPCNFLIDYDLSCHGTCHCTHC